eukprot:CAMPEP_0206590674 /NCGR_PEP_ID=MMETSP0325_2-20121206/39777_1 /ASSEMBLY_ACC=CAM_ASM_000347 /TAXON_ID=2866 /ORGANISM="Crypthecodinium cohnii, Strain Seligo" /LENGTH=33 /DNA_ID= /DNA_START= /DNA_END= /DNA_ORIENTATION=
MKKRNSLMAYELQEQLTDYRSRKGRQGTNQAIP